MAKDENQPINSENKKTVSNESSSSVSFNKPSKNPSAKGYNPNLVQMARNPKYLANRAVVKTGIVSAANTLAPGVGGAFAEKYLETQEGQEILDEAANQSNPVEAAKVAAKEIVKRRTRKIIIIGAILSACLIFLILLPIMILFGKNPSSIGSNGERSEEYDELYEKIDEVRYDYLSKYGVRIDGNLIMASLTAYHENEEYTVDNQNETETITDIDEEGNVSIREVSVMISKIELLAKYQIMTTTGGSCDSGTMRQIASNDDNGLFDQLKSPADKEKNYKCQPDLETTTYSLSNERGDYDDNNSGGVYYWNLIDGDFIKEYYSDYMPNNEENSDNTKKRIRQIVEDIYDYYETLDEEEMMCNIVYTNCPGIKLEGMNETLDLETYVAGVIKAEMGANANLPETMKASAVAARSFAISQSDNCNKVLSNSTAHQVFKNIDPSDPFDQKFIEYAQQTAGQVVIRNGAVMSTLYSTAPPNQTTVNGVKHYRLQRDPNDPNTLHTYKIPVNDESRIASKNGGYLLGHNWGMSQYGNIYEGEKGTPYRDILTLFYGEDTTLSSLSTSTGVGGGCSPDEGGLSVADASGFRARTAMPTRDNQFYFSSLNLSYASGYTGQCTWYAFGRANETLTNAGSDLRWRHAPDAVRWYDFNNADGTSGFKASKDPYKPKVGAIIVWSGGLGGHGHVAFVEKVNANGTIDYSEANIGVAKSPSNPYGWRYNSNVSLDNIKYMSSSYSFVGYIYMVE